MTNGLYRETYIIKLGGSLIVPSKGIAIIADALLELAVKSRAGSTIARYP